MVFLDQRSQIRYVIALKLSEKRSRSMPVFPSILSGFPSHLHSEWCLNSSVQQKRLGVILWSYISH